MMHTIFRLLTARVAAGLPVPRDLDLPLPLGELELKVILVVLFLAHIFFVNLMVGGSILTVLFEIVGLDRKRYDLLAKKIADTITVNKSLAVVLGVGPLLCINLVYTIHFYSANALTGYGWISIIPLVVLAFLLSYLHKYTWETWTGARKRLHIIVGSLSALLFLSIPLIFLANINLMLFPESWDEVGGLFSSLRVGNVFPRYFHFLAASLALTGLFLAGWFGRKGYPVETYLSDFTRPELRRCFYRLAFYATLAQFAFGPLLLFTLPNRGVGLKLVVIIMAGIALALAVMVLLSREISASDDRMGRRFVAVLILFGLVVLAMGTGRHLYRETSLASHKTMIQDETERFNAIMLATHMRLDAGMGAGETIPGGPTGKSVFQNCAACHAVDKILAAPSLVEIYSIYAGNPRGIVQWAKNPGKKRPEFAPMPSFAHLGDEKLELVAEYMLEVGAPGGESETESAAPTAAP